MKQANLFTKTIKELPKDEQSYNAQALIRAGFIDKVSAGIYSFLPLGLKVLNNIRRIIVEEMEAVGGQEISLTALAPKDLWAKTSRLETMDVLFRLAGSDQKEYVLNPTHEEEVSPLAKKFVTSYKDLPFSVFQIQTKFRNEKRAKSGLLRGREFLMKDLYSFHTDQEDLDNYYERVLQAYYKIYERLGLKEKTYLTFAAGGSFSKYSHEFQTFTEAGEDLIYCCDACRLAVNREIIAEQKTCPGCGNADLIERKAVEVGNIFKLGTAFSKPFNLTYRTADGEEKLVVMGCYGIGLSRVLGAVVEVCHDERGIIWPATIAPFKIHLLSLNQDEAAARIYQDLQAAGFEVLFDDRDKGAGEKFAEADLIGCPWRVVVSAKTLAAGGVEVKARSGSKEEIVNTADLIKYLK
ncbi:MAG: aminoacyl--tRNA ligase-related protein [Candidatus Parcubacteria bacterium]|jgi:prolyl-tRNA synthetase|nr:MAG: proline--tRNA ligase [Candidatus Parcubacteria bacterium]